MAEQIILYSGPKHSGKTTALQSWASERTGTAGLLTPVIEGQRWFQDLQTGALFPMEALEGEEALPVGRYQFSKASFDRACRILREAARLPSAVIIVDEIGPLELRGEGFARVVRELIAAPGRGPLVLVIREELRDAVTGYFSIPEAALVLSPKDPI